MVNFNLFGTVLVLALAFCVSFAAHEGQKRAEHSDVQILNYALTLEYMESAFYTQALAKFDNQTFNDSGMNRSFFEEIASHESDHVNILSNALGKQATKACNYSFPYTDIKGFASLSMVLEGVGVSAYLGAAALIIDKDYLTAAGSILTTEARHSAYVSTVSSNAQAPWSQGFDVPLDFNQVYSLAAPFIVSCPSTNPSLPVKSFPSFNITTSRYTGGSNVTFASVANITNNTSNNQLHVAFLTGLSAIYMPYDVASKSVVIPANLTGSGTVYAVLTTANATSGTAVPTDETTLAGPTVLLFPNNATTGATSASNTTTGERRNGASKKRENIELVLITVLGFIAATL